MSSLTRHGISLCLALGGLIAAVAAQTSELQTVRTAEGATELRLGSGKAFHSTTQAVSDLRLVQVENSPVLLVLWRERDTTGTNVPFYAISLNGHAFATVRETSYAIEMRRASFDPLVNVPTFTGSPLPAGQNVYFVQFVTQPLEEFRAAITALGGKILTYVTNHTYLVRMDGAIADQVRALNFVRWVGPVHGEYRVDESLVAAMYVGMLPTQQRYNVQLYSKDLATKGAAAQKIQAIGGATEVTPGGYILEAVLTPDQLAATAGFEEVEFIDKWGAPETDIDIARIVMGANYVETAGGFKGTGVRGEVLDAGVRATHQEFVANSPLAGQPGLVPHGGQAVASHGTCTTGEVFAHGVSPLHRGMLPFGTGITAYYNAIVPDRPTFTAQIVQSPYFCVFQTNSWGDPQTTAYTTKSAEIDDIVFDNDLIILNSMSNLGNTSCRPQAWGKNVVSIGGVFHFDTAALGDDHWGGGGSTGPAADGRIKPELTNFYDAIRTSDSCSDSCYTTGFGGTSGATPITAGCFGLFFEMWHNGIFGNPHPGATVFDNRAHAMTAKAIMINTAKPYNWLAGGANADLTRVRQGWGLPDLQKVYDLRSKMFIVDETDLLTNLQTMTYNVTVGAGEPELRVTMCYLDPQGTVGALFTRKNDLSLKVTSPSSTVYWGLNGLSAGLFSTSGGVANARDTVENVFIQSPAAGTWIVEVIGSDINSDSHVETGAVDADFALVVSGVGNCASPTTYCAAKLNSMGCLPAIASTGSPSATATSGFVETCSQVRNNKPGLLFYGTSGQASTPFQNGTLCVNAPIKRTPVISSNGNPFPADDCSGLYSIDMNAFSHGLLGGSPLPALIVVGTVVDTQWWGRDPGFAPPDNTTLSNGLEYTVCP
jgi:hypothetical protein